MRTYALCKIKGASPTIKDRLQARLGHKYNTFLLKDHIMTKEFSSIMELKAIREQKSRNHGVKGHS